MCSEGLERRGELLLVDELVGGLARVHEGLLEGPVVAVVGQVGQLGEVVYVALVQRGSTVFVLRVGDANDRTLITQKLLDEAPHVEIEVGQGPDPVARVEPSAPLSGGRSAPLDGCRASRRSDPHRTSRRCAQ